MARPGPEQDLVASVLDRLIDREPRTTTEPEPRRSTGLAQLKEAVKRDLEWLLNTRRLIVEPPDDTPQLGNSLLTYGLPDFTHANLGLLENKGELRRIIEEAIARFEPRLSHVAVTMLEGSPTDRSLRFRIDAVLDVEPSPEAISFDSRLQIPTNAIVVKEA